MKILVLGSGLMGPAAAYNCLQDPDVSEVAIADMDQAQLDACRAKLRPHPGSDRLRAVRHDLRDAAATVALMRGFDAILGALPHAASIMAIRAAAKAGVPILDLSRLADEEVAMLRGELEAAGARVILGCGLEPGLTEIMTRYLAEQLDHVDEVHIKCGGIPEVPAPPLGYKIVFGGRRLPLQERDAWIVREGRLEPVPRYSGVEPVRFVGVGECEAWHEGFMPWLLELPQLRGLRLGTQKTVRWPGYAAKVTVLKELGLLSEEPLAIGGAEIAPKDYIDTLLYPKVRLEEGERDITVFRVEASGEKDGRPRRYTIEMIDRYDDATGFTSMARTTAFTGAIVTRMLARGEIAATGAIPPEQVITGPLLARLVRELAAAGVRFDLGVTRVDALEIPG